MQRPRDALIIAGGLVILTLAAWAWQVRMSLAMQETSGAGWQWTPGAILMTFIMWVVMIVAMMLPTTLPFVATYMKLADARRAQMSPLAGTWVFILGYGLAWIAASAAATGLQMLLDKASLLSGSMAIAGSGLGGAVLLAAGVYQFTPLKHACANQCRTPVGFFLAHWRDGPRGALAMGARHGAACVGCCWLLMAILFVAGVMNLAWMLGLTAVILMEKLPHIGQRVRQVAGVAAIAGGVLLITLA